MPMFGSVVALLEDKRSWVGAGGGGGGAIYSSYIWTETKQFRILLSEVVLQFSYTKSLPYGFYLTTVLSAHAS